MLWISSMQNLDLRYKAGRIFRDPQPLLEVPSLMEIVHLHSTIFGFLGALVYTYCFPLSTNFSMQKLVREQVGNREKLLFIATPFAAHGQNQHLSFHEMVNLSIQTLYRTNSERKLRKVLCCFPRNVAADGEDLTTTFSCFQIGGIVLLVKSVKPVKCYLQNFLHFKPYADCLVQESEHLGWVDDVLKIAEECCM